MIDFMGPEHIVWGSDYPHEEGFAPHWKLAIRGSCTTGRRRPAERSWAATPLASTALDLYALVPVATRYDA